jgi:hypothetical protein
MIRSDAWSRLKGIDGHMKTTFEILKKEDGMALVVTLLILVLITIIAITASQDTVIELQIVRNDLVYKDHLYRSEAAAMEGVQWVENASASELNNFGGTAFLGLASLDLSNLNLNDGRWSMAGVDPDQDAAKIIDGFTIVDDTGMVDLSAESNVYTYRVYGHYNRLDGMNRGRSLIELGYKKRF